jgi:hypothetical protein
MHTALRIGVAAAAKIRELGATAHVCFYGHYAVLNAPELLATSAQSVLAGEIEDALIELVHRLEMAPSPPVASTPVLTKLAFPVPERSALPALKKYAHVERDGRRELAAYVEASRGCKHLCRHCPIPPVYGGRFFVVPVETVLADVRQQVAAGAGHVTFGDPDFLNGPRHALTVARALHAEFPALTFDFTAKVEHLLRERAHLPELAALGARSSSPRRSRSTTACSAIWPRATRGADSWPRCAPVRGAASRCGPTWVAFTPWTTLASYREWLDFLAAEALVDHVDPVQYGIRLLVPPGSLLLELPEMRAHVRENGAGGFHHRWTHPDSRVDRLADDVAGSSPPRPRRTRTRR